MGIVGGEPPSIKDIQGKDNLRQARLLCGYLFKDNYDSHWSLAMREMLFALVLRFYLDVFELLEQHPMSDYRNIRSHPFVRVLLQALDDVGIDLYKFNDWCIDIRKGFLQRNCIALPIVVLGRNGYDGLKEIQIDARSFLTQMNALTRVYMMMSNHMISIGEGMHCVINQQDRLEQMLEKVLELNVTNSRKEEEEERLAYSDIVSTYQPKTLAKLFVVSSRTCFMSCITTN
ncbi:hypothetical protein ACA910_014827 [Epithemia clementina (nom. ined.)]